MTNCSPCPWPALLIVLFSGDPKLAWIDFKVGKKSLVILAFCSSLDIPSYMDSSLPWVIVRAFCVIVRAFCVLVRVVSVLARVVLVLL